MQEIDRSHRISDWTSAAGSLRRRVSDLFGVGPEEHIVLAPGILIGLHVLIHSLDVRRLCLSDREYYGQPHFPALEVHSFGLDNPASAMRERPDAVLVSLVTWRGEQLPMAGIFDQLRAGRRNRAPLLVADCTHAGAIGFPALDQFGADVVCGDTGKWIFPAERESRIAFFWFRTAALAGAARRTFEPFFLATGSRDELLRSRWLDPAEVKSVACWYQQSRLRRTVLRRRHRANLDLTSRLAVHYGVPHTEGNCILRLPGGTCADALLRKLDKLGLVWRLPDGDIRVLCRADLFHE